jgi:hypothetical protein
MSAATIINSLKLSSQKDGCISVAHIDRPYGDLSDPVVSIGVSLKPDPTPQWQVHIPYRDLDAVIELLHEAKRYRDAHDTGSHPHDELASDTGGGA